MNNIRVAIADDHKLLRSGLVQLVESLGFEVIGEADNGAELTDMIKAGLHPDVILMDINMPIMDGLSSTKWLKDHYPKIKVLGLSMLNDDPTIIKMIRNGAKGYLLKDTEPNELKTAITEVFTKGFYFSPLVNGRLINSIANDLNEGLPESQHLNEKELVFLRLICSDKSYREIADEMCLSVRTIDGYRDNLFQKLNVESRIGLVLFAIKHRIFIIE
jgi:two-component system, NarL family, invasion response regulator UvrY